MFRLNFIIVLILLFILQNCSKERSVNLNFVHRKGFYEKKRLELKGKVAEVHIYNNTLKMDTILTPGFDRTGFIQNLYKDTSVYKLVKKFDPKGKILSNGNDLYFYDDSGFLIRYEDRDERENYLRFQVEYFYNKEYTTLKTISSTVRKVFYLPENFETDAAYYKAVKEAPDTATVESADFYTTNPDGSFSSYGINYLSGEKEYISSKITIRADSSIVEQKNYNYPKKLKLWTRKYHNPNRELYKKESINFSDSTVSTVTYIKQDTVNNRISYKSFYSDDKTPYFTIYNSLNENGDPITTSYEDKQNHQTFQESISYIYDDHKNWIAKFILRDGKPSSYSIREIRYWD